MTGLFAFLLFLGSVASDCPNGFTVHDNSCYALIREKASWAEAVVYCQAIGATLARVESNTENQFLKAWLTRETSLIQTAGVWLGGHDYLVEGEWQWAFDGAKIVQTWWYPGNPSTYGNDGTQSCLMLWKEHGFLWDDNNCDFQDYFLCETEAATDPVIG